MFISINLLIISFIICILIEHTLDCTLIEAVVGRNMSN